MIQSKHEEAIKEATAIYPEFVSRLGPDHELTMQLLSTRAQSELSLGIWNDTIRDDLAIHELAVHKQGALSFFAIAPLIDRSLAQCRSGQVREGEPNARQAYNDSVKAFGPHAGLTGGAAYAFASCLISTGKLEEASTLLRQIDISALAQLTGNPDCGVDIKLAQAETAYRRGDYDSARAYLQAVTPVFTRKDAEPYQKHAFDMLMATLEKSSPRR